MNILRAVDTYQSLYNISDSIFIYMDGGPIQVNNISYNSNNLLSSFTAVTRFGSYDYDITYTQSGSIESFFVENKGCYQMTSYKSIQNTIIYCNNKLLVDSFIENKYHLLALFEPSDNGIDYESFINTLYLQNKDYNDLNLVFLYRQAVQHTIDKLFSQAGPTPVL